MPNDHLPILMNHTPPTSPRHSPITLSKLLPVLLAVSLLVGIGCKDEEEFSRYPSVSVPGYDLTNYIPDLAHSNPEVVLNAVVILGSAASDFGKQLGGDKADPASEGYRIADEVYHRVLPLLQSRHPQVVAASLHFFQRFSSQFSRKAELVSPISQIQSPHPLVQFEQVTALQMLGTNVTQLPAPLLRRLVASPSWLVARQTYGLIDSLRDPALRAELLQRYPSLTEERERLLLLTAFTREPGPAAIELLQRELLTSASPRLRQSAGQILVANLELPGLLDWFISHYSQFRPEDRTALFEAHHVSELHIAFIARGYVPDDDFLPRLIMKLEDESDEGSDYRLRLEKAVVASPALAAQWQRLRADRARARAQFAAIEKEYAPLAQAFREQSRAVFLKHKVPAENQNQFIEQIPALNRLGLR